MGLHNTNMGPHHNMVKNTIKTYLNQVEILTNKMLSLQKKIKNMQISTNKTYSTQDLCLYSFDRSI